MAHPFATQIKDGIEWHIGGQAEVDWISEQTEGGRQITAAIPSSYAAYATLTNHPAAPDLPRDLSLERRQDLAFVNVLRRHAGSMDWWLGYLNTGASDIVFGQAPKVTIYPGWRYVLVLAGPDQAATWRPAPHGETELEEHRTARGDVPQRSLLARLIPLGRRLGLHRRNRGSDQRHCSRSGARPERTSRRHAARRDAARGLARLASPLTSPPDPLWQRETGDLDPPHLACARSDERLSSHRA